MKRADRKIAFVAAILLCCLPSSAMAAWNLGNFLKAVLDHLQGASEAPVTNPPRPQKPPRAGRGAARAPPPPPREPAPPGFPPTPTPSR